MEGLIVKSQTMTDFVSDRYIEVRSVDLGESDNTTTEHY